MALETAAVRFPWRCWLRGHRWTLMLDQGHVFLQCASCASTTPGWWMQTEGLVEIVKPTTDSGPGVDPIYENCPVSEHKHHRFDVYDGHGVLCCRYCWQPFDVCIRRHVLEEPR